MREKLGKVGNEQRHTYTAKFERFGTKTSFGYTKQTVLLIRIKDKNNKLITDHLWFNFGKGFEKLNLKKGDLIQFDARTNIYFKGYFKDEIDYRLSWPTNIKKINLD